MTDSTGEESSADGNVYEMLWDCKHCGSKKLLGLTHRHCPVCGAPQNAESRYYPSEADKVAVKDHVYYGKDVVCRYCSAYNSRSAKHCRECGSPLAEGSEAHTVAEQVHDEGTFDGQTAAGPAPEVAKPKAKSRTGLFVFLGIAAAVVTSLIVFFSWKRDAAFEVAGHSWERSVAIERFGPATESGWCDSLPAGAKVSRSYRAVRSHEKVPDGKKCKVRKVDKGDGTFSEKKECTTKYKDKPIEDDKCDYKVNKWSAEKTEKSSGSGLTPEPTWPQVNTGAKCSRVGCRRPGAKSEKYTVTLKGGDGATESCDLSQSRWKDMAAGRRFKGEVRVMGGGLDCDSLKPQ